MMTKRRIVTRTLVGLVIGFVIPLCLTTINGFVSNFLHLHILNWTAAVALLATLYFVTFLATIAVPHRPIPMITGVLCGIPVSCLVLYIYWAKGHTLPPLLN